MRLEYVMSLWCAVLLCLLYPVKPVFAAGIAGAEFPDKLVQNGQTLILNGFGVRSYLGFKIYAAALYVTEKTRDETQIIASPALRVLKMHYFIDIDQDDARQAWQDSFSALCSEPCRFSQQIMQFTSYITAINKDDQETYIFSSDGLEVVLKPERAAIKIQGRNFSELVLATWIGQFPPTEDLKQGLLGKLLVM